MEVMQHGFEEGRGGRVCVHGGAQRVHHPLDGGIAVTLEFIPNADRVSPANAATFALTMLATTPSGDTYTFAEYEAIFASAGFAASELIEIPDSPQRVVVSRR